MKLILMAVTVAVCLGATPAAHAKVNDESMFNHSFFGQKVITAEGTALLAGDMNLDSGYELAERMAKSSAAKQFGEYYEVVREVDDVTGEIKEVVVSVNAAIMKYQVVSRKVDTVDGNIVLSVVIEATADEKDLSAALNRYYQNKEGQKDIDLMSEQVAGLQNKVSAQESLIKRLLSGQYLGDHKQVALIQSDLAVDLEDYSTKLNSIKSALVVDGSSVVQSYREGFIYDGREKYVSMLRQYFDNVDIVLLEMTEPNYLNDTQETLLRVRMTSDLHITTKMFERLELEKVSRRLRNPVYTDYVEVMKSNPTAAFVYDYNVDLVVVIDGVRLVLPIIKSYSDRGGVYPDGIYFNQKFTDADDLFHVNFTKEHEAQVDSFFDGLTYTSALGSNVVVEYQLVLTEISSNKVFDINADFQVIK